MRVLLWMALAATALPVAASLTEAARIMCLGDSITLGVGGGGYRESLANLIQQHDGGDASATVMRPLRDLTLSLDVTRLLLDRTLPLLDH